MQYQYYSGFLLFLLIFSFSNISVAQDCAFEISPDQKEVDGIEMGISPGDTLCLLSGRRAEIAFTNLSGTKENPIIIINKGGKVMIDTEGGKAISFRNSVHFRLSGTGSNDPYGIEIASSGIMGVEITEFSSDVEVDHLEIHDVGFAGIMAKTDPNCSRKDLRYFTMRNISFHDNYIYDAGGEGFYVGYSWYPEREVECDGVSTTYYPHPIHGVRIYNNIIRDTQWDALQVGSSPIDVRIYGNTITNYGIENELYQNHGVQIGEGTTGHFYNNIIDTGTGGGISFFGSGNNRLYNNLIMNTGEQAIYQNDRGARAGTNYKIVNNTIINPHGAGIMLNASKTTNNVVSNNLIVLDRVSSAITIGNSSRWTKENNLVFGSLEEAGFQDAASGDYHLKQDSPAIDAGSDISWLRFDLENMQRPAMEGFDVGAYEYGAAPYEPSPLGIDNQQAEEQFVVYPNPAGDSIFIRMAENSRAGQTVVTLLNGEGKKVLKKTISLNPGQQGIEIDGAKIPEGIYYLYFEIEGQQSELYRIIKNQ